MAQIVFCRIMAISKIPSEELFRRYSEGDPEAYRILRSDMEDLARAVAHRFAEDATEEELVPIGMTYFDFALKRYAERRKELSPQVPYKFSTYFTWYIRESIRTYLGGAEVPLKRIRPKSRE